MASAEPFVKTAESVTYVVALLLLSGGLALATSPAWAATALGAVLWFDLHDFGARGGRDE